MTHPAAAAPSPPVIADDTCAVLLAAGAGSRFGGATHKLLAELRGRPVWHWSLQAVLDAGFHTVVVVTGAAPLDLPAQVITAHNTHWLRGQAGSLQTGVAAARAAGMRRIVIGLADQPFIPAATWARVATADLAAPIAVAVYDGVRGPNPVRLDHTVWPLLPIDGDSGARDVIREHPSWVAEIACVGSTADIDTLEDLERWTNC